MNAVATHSAKFKAPATLPGEKSLGWLRVGPSKFSFKFKQNCIPIIVNEFVLENSDNLKGKESQLH